jgi:hypothetical protein
MPKVHFVELFFSQILTLAIMVTKSVREKVAQNVGSPTLFA